MNLCKGGDDLDAKSRRKAAIYDSDRDQPTIGSDSNWRVQGNDLSRAVFVKAPSQYNQYTYSVINFWPAHGQK